MSDEVGEISEGLIPRCPREFREAAEDDALIVREDGIAVVLAGVEVETIIDYVVRVDESRGDEPVVGFDGFIVVVAD
jgi:hypothetical protein